MTLRRLGHGGHLRRSLPRLSLVSGLLTLCAVGAGALLDVSLRHHVSFVVLRGCVGKYAESVTPIGNAADCRWPVWRSFLVEHSRPLFAS
jgi:hypothetical protein